MDSDYLGICIVISVFLEEVTWTVPPLQLSWGGQRVAYARFPPFFSALGYCLMSSSTPSIVSRIPSTRLGSQVSYVSCQSGSIWRQEKRALRYIPQLCATPLPTHLQPCGVRLPHLVLLVWGAGRPPSEWAWESLIRGSTSEYPRSCLSV